MLDMEMAPDPLGVWSYLLFPRPPPLSRSDWCAHPSSQLRPFLLVCTLSTNVVSIAVTDGKFSILAIETRQYIFDLVYTDAS